MTIKKTLTISHHKWENNAKNEKEKIFILEKNENIKDWFFLTKSEKKKSQLVYIKLSQLLHNILI